MGMEIERKFLLRDNENPCWKEGVEPVCYCQGYLSANKDCTVRVRIAGEQGFITVKSANTGAVRQEFEYEIPRDDALDMLQNLAAKPLIEKLRYRVAHAGRIWEVDEFLGENQGLIVAEVELASEDETLDIPSWAGLEVTGDARYYNSNLVKTPFSRWNKN